MKTLCILQHRHSISYLNAIKFPGWLTFRHPFGEMPQRDPSHLNALLVAHARNKEHSSTLLLFHRMRYEGICVDGYTFTPVLTACSALPNGGVKLVRQVHALMIKTGCHSGLILGTSLLDVYSKCGHLGDAVSVFGEMDVKDVVAWNALLSCFVLHGLAKDAISAFRSMLEDGVVFSGFTLCTVLKACTSSSTLRQGKQIHAQVIVSGYESLVIGTALIDFYSSCGLMQDSIEVFNRLNCPKDVAIHNALISGCVRNKRYREVFSMLEKVRPNAITLTCALSACSESSNLSHGKQIHCIIIRHGFDCDTILCNALIDMYAKCGEITAAHLVFDGIGEKNMITWTSIIDAYGSHGHGIEALKLFKKMEEQKCDGIYPNAVTFLSVLSACGHSGLVDEGRDCFFFMRDKHGLDPGPEHCACLIDLLGRAGRIEEAWDLFCGMSESGRKLTSAVCVAMLNACRVSMDLVRGEYVAKQLLELGPDNPGNYVSISNFYAAVGRWEGAEDLRRAMRDRGLKKEVGSSWIAVESCN